MANGSQKRGGGSPGGGSAVNKQQREKAEALTDRESKLVNSNVWGQGTYVDGDGNTVTINYEKHNGRIYQVLNGETQSTSIEVDETKIPKTYRVYKSDGSEYSTLDQGDALIAAFGTMNLSVNQEVAQKRAKERIHIDVRKPRVGSGLTYFASFTDSKGNSSSATSNSKSGLYALMREAGASAQQIRNAQKEGKTIKASHYA